MKIESRGNARAHVFSVRLYCPAVVTKLERPRLSRLQPLLSFAWRPAACVARAREAKTQQEKGSNFKPGASARKIRHSALSSTTDRLRSIRRSTACVHVKQCSKARVAVFGYHAKNMSVRFSPSRNTGRRKWVNGHFFHPFPP